MLAESKVKKLFGRKEVEAAFLECFELIGGIPRMAMWANDPKNYTKFIELYVRFAPKDDTGPVEKEFTYISKVPQSPLNVAASNPPPADVEDAVLIEQLPEDNSDG